MWFLLAEAESAPNLWAVLLSVSSVLGAAVTAYFALRGKQTDKDGKAEERQDKKDAAAEIAERRAYDKLLDSRERTIERLEAKIDEFGKTLIDYAGKIGALESEVKALKAREHEKDQRIGEYATKLSDATTKIADLTATLVLRDATIDKLTHELAMEQQENAMLIQQNEALAEKLKKAGVTP